MTFLNLALSSPLRILRVHSLLHVPEVPFTETATTSGIFSEP
jgi:hypothetical protein